VFGLSVFIYYIIVLLFSNIATNGPCLSVSAGKSEYESLVKVRKLNRIPNDDIATQPRIALRQCYRPREFRRIASDTYNSYLVAKYNTNKTFHLSQILLHLPEENTKKSYVAWKNNELVAFG